MAPETLNYDPIDFKTDMWSVGVLCQGFKSLIQSKMITIVVETDLDPK